MAVEAVARAIETDKQIARGLLMMQNRIYPQMTQMMKYRRKKRPNDAFQKRSGTSSLKGKHSIVSGLFCVSSSAFICG